MANSMLDAYCCKRTAAVSRLIRLLRIDSLVRRGSFPNVEQLSELLEVKPRTVFQDVKELRELFGLDIRFDRHHGGYFLANPAATLPASTLGEDEALLLVVAAELLYHFGGGTFRGVLEPALDQILGDLNGLARAVVACLEFDTPPPPTSSRVFIGLLKAIRAKRVVSLRPFEVNEFSAPQQFLPSKLNFSNREWQVVGQPSIGGGSKLIRVDKIGGVAPVNSADA